MVAPKQKRGVNAMEKKETLDAIEERIKALEGEVRTLRAQNAGLGACLAGLIVLVAVSYFIVVGMELKLLRVLRVERIEFVKDGELIAYIDCGSIPGMSDVLSINDKDGNPIVVIGSITGEFLNGTRGLSVFNMKGEGVAGIVATPEGSGRISIMNKKGNIVAVLGAQDIKTSFTYPDSGYLFIINGDGIGGIALQCDPKGNGAIVVRNKDWSIGASLGCSDYGGLLGIFRNYRVGNTAQAAVTIGITTNGAGGIVTTNRSGTPIWSTPAW